MHIITSDDKDFNDLLEVVRDGFVVGKSWHDGTEKIVYATRLLMVVFHGSEPDRIAVVPARNELESHELAQEYLRCEEEKGNPVELNH